MLTNIFILKSSLNCLQLSIVDINWMAGSVFGGISYNVSTIFAKSCEKSHRLWTKNLCLARGLLALQIKIPFGIHSKTYGWYGRRSAMPGLPTGHWPWPQPPPLRRPWPCRIRPLLGLARWSQVVSANLFCYAEINLFWMPVALEKVLRFLARHTKYCRTTLIFKHTQCTYSKVQFYMNVPVIW